MPQKLSVSSRRTRLQRKEVPPSSALAAAVPGATAETMEQRPGAAAASGTATAVQRQLRVQLQEDTVVTLVVLQAVRQAEATVAALLEEPTGPLQRTTFLPETICPSP